MRDSREIAFHDFSQWDLFLNDFLNADKNESGKRLVSEIHTLSELILRDDLLAADRVKIISQLKRLDSVRQLFLLPWVMEQLDANPASRVLRRRLFAYFSALLQGECAKLLEVLEDAFEKDFSPDSLHTVLHEMSDFLIGRTADNKQGMDELASQRGAVFCLAALTVVQKRVTTPDAKVAVQDFLENEEQKGLRDLLKKWLFNGPLFFRFLLIDWSVASSFGLRSGCDAAAQDLMELYLQDADSLIASFAIQGYACCVPQSDMPNALENIKAELAEFKTRKIYPGWRKEQVRMISAGQLRALGILALKYDPAVNELIRLLETRPRFQIVFSNQPDKLNFQERIIEAACLMFSEQIEIRGTIQYGQKYAAIGCLTKKIMIPYHLQVQEGEDVWMKQNYNKFKIIRRSSKSDCQDFSESLYDLIAPRLHWFDDEAERISSKVRQKTLEEVKARAEWITAACGIVKRLLCNYFDKNNQDNIISESNKAKLIDFLSKYAATTANWSSDESRDTNADIKYPLRWTFLKEFPPSQISSLCNNEDAVPPLYQSFLAGLASTASEQDFDFIKDNPERLSSVVAAQVHIQYRAWAGMALFLHKTMQSQYSFVIEHEERRSLLKYASFALALLNDKSLVDLINENDLSEKTGIDLAALPEEFKEKKNEDQQFKSVSKKIHLWAELLARSLRTECSSDYAKLAHPAALVCLSAFMYGDKKEDIFPALLRMRLLKAFAECPVKQNASSIQQHVLSHLLRSASSNQLEYYFQYIEKKLPNLDAFHENLLISILDDEEMHLDLSKAHRVADRFACKRFVMKKLIKEMENRKRNSIDLFKKYFKVRCKAWNTPETGSLIIAKGVKRENESGAIFTPAGSKEPLDNELMQEIIPCFISNPYDDDEFDCLVKFRSAPEGTINFYNKNINEERENLKSNLKKGKAFVVSRVVEVKEKNIVVDLGTDLDRQLQRQPELSKPALDVRKDDAVIVALTKYGEKTIKVKYIEFKSNEIGHDCEEHDLRDHDDASGFLKERWNRRHRNPKPFSLRGEVKEVRQLQGRKLICCDCFRFQVKDKNGRDVWPGYIHKENSSIPKVGDEILLPPVDLYSIKFFLDEGNVDFSLWDEHKLLAGRELSVILESKGSDREELSHDPGKYMRKWFGKIDNQRLPVLRKELTGDLGKLFDLDSRDDSDRIFDELSQNAVRVKVMQDGRSLSLLQATPRWRLQDVILAFSAKIFEDVEFVFIEKIEKEMRYLFEMSYKNFEYGVFDFVSILGDIVTLEEGEFDHIDDNDDKLIKGARYRCYYIEEDCILLVMDSNDGFREAFHRNTEVKGIVKKKSTYCLSDSWEYSSCFSQPFLQLTDSAKQGNKFLAKQDWKPFSEKDEYILHVDILSDLRKIKFSSNEKEKNKQIERFFLLEEGCLLKEKIDIRKKFCLFSNIRLSLDSLSSLIFDDSDSFKYFIKKYPHLHLEYPVCISKNSLGGHNAELPEILNIPYLNEQKEVYGLVVGTPYRENKSEKKKKISVIWVEGNIFNGEYIEHSEEMEIYVPIEYKFYNCDIIRASCENKPKKIDRYIQASLITPQEIMSFEYWYRIIFKDWFRNTIDDADKEEEIQTTLIHIPKSSEEEWQFVFPSAHLVKISDKYIMNPDRLREDAVWKLDKIKMRVKKIKNDCYVEILDHTDCPLHKAVNEQNPAEIDVKFIDYNNQSVRYNLRINNDIRLDNLLFQSNDLPSSSEWKGVRDIIKNKTKIKVSLFNSKLTQYDIVDDGKVFSLKMEFGGAAAVRQKRALNDEMKNKKRLPDARGKSVDSSPEELGVRLHHYEHNELLPLPREEQCWVHISHKPRIRNGWEGKFTVFRNSEGELTASLRRNTPQRLAAWLEKQHINSGGEPFDLLNEQRRISMFFYGPLTEEDAVECGLKQNLTAAEENDLASNKLFLFECEDERRRELYAIYARSEQIQLYGKALPEHGLHLGDKITLIEKIECDIRNSEEAEERSGEHGINIIRYELDIVWEMDNFTRKNGFYFGKVRYSAEDRQFSLIEVRGKNYSDTKFGTERWKFQLDEQQGDSIPQEYDGYVYLKKVRVDEKRRIIFFAIVQQQDVFTQNNLVFVRGGTKETYGATFKYSVKPLYSSWGETLYFIPDTLYSMRRGRLNESRVIEKGIFLAKVHSKDAKKGTKLSLLDIPSRSYRYFMTKEQCKKGKYVIVKESSKKDLVEVESDEGVIVSIPVSRLNDYHEKNVSLRKGDLILLDPDFKRYKINIKDIINGQSHSIQEISGVISQTFQTQLWRAYRERLEDWQQKNRRSFDCNIIGFSQLIGEGTLRDESSAGNEEGVVFQIFKKYDEKKGIVSFEEGLGEHIDIGRLKIGDDNEPYLLFSKTGKKVLTWKNTTFRQGDADFLSQAMKAASWIDDKNDKNARCQTIDSAWFIVGQELSLTARAAAPFPVEYLIDQFIETIEKKGQQLKFDKQLNCVAAGRRKGELVLEIAPGRFAVLPEKLIRLPSALYHAGAEFFSSGIEPGDELTLQLDQSDENSLLPYVHIMSVSFGASRQLPEQLFTNPMEHLADQAGAHDLRKVSLPDRKAELRRLKEQSEQCGSPCILKGRVSGIHPKNSNKIFVDIGLKVPVPNREDNDPLIDSYSCSFSVKKHDTVCLRVDHLDFDDNNQILIFKASLHQYEKFEISSSNNIAAVTLLHSELKYQIKVAGLEDYSVEWRQEGDPLNLPASHTHLLENNIDSLLATVESINPYRPVVTLSRQRQLAFLPKNPDQIFQGKIIGRLDDERLLINFAGLLLPLHRYDFCHGSSTFTQEFADQLRDREIDLAWSDGKLNAKKPWCQPEQEFDAHVVVTCRQGVLAREKRGASEGFYVFIPKEELACCKLDEELLDKLFPQKMKIRIARIDAEEKYSFIHNYDIQADINELVRMKNAADGMTFVSCPIHGKEIVRRHSGLLMNFVGAVDTLDEKNFRAYVQKIDVAGRDITLAKNPRPIAWDSLPKSDFLDDFTPRVVEERCAQLKEKFDKDAFNAWIKEQECLSITPRNLRIIIETIKVLNGDLLCLSIDNADNLPEIAKIWQRILTHLKDEHAAPENLEGTCAFAIGYWLLLDNQPEKSLPFLQAAQNDPKTGQSFGVRLAVIRATQLCKKLDEACDLLKKLGDRVWLNAIHTLPFPLIEPHPSEKKLYSRWNECVKNGNREEFIEILKDMTSEEEGVKRYAFSLTKKFLSGEVNIDIDFNEMLDEIFNDDHDINMMAAKLHFSRSNISEGLHYLRKIKDDKTALFWQSWLSGASLSDKGILGRLADIYNKCRWNDCSDIFSQFDMLWEEHRKSNSEWLLPRDYFN